MKIFKAVLALAGAAGLAIAAPQGKPINDTCPVKGTPIKNITTTYKGKTIGFC
jgi:hypothetical protein